MGTVIFKKSELLPTGDGRWMIPPMTWHKSGDDIIVACEHGHFCLVSDKHKIADDGIITPGFACSTKDCRFDVMAQLDEWKEKLVMYCVSWERIKWSANKRAIAIPQSDYFRAISVENAKFQFMAANPYLRDGINMKLVGIAPVIGYHALDDNADSVLA